ncbi:MAG TPA: amino acid permease [Nannocystaceae bacterium]|nr:amino acid permease [Nannocystaceae bacterium]
MADPHTDRRLGPYAAMALVAGSMLGAGIFIAPPTVAAHIDRPGAFLLIWVLGGISALCGALSVAELGAMMPRAGGDYPYLRRAYGPGLAFATGWLQLLAVFPGSLAVVAVGTAHYQLPLMFDGAFAWPATLGVDPAMFWAVAIVLVLTAVNHVGVAVSGRLQVVITVLPITLLLLGTVAAIAYHGIEGGALATAEAQVRLPPLPAMAAAFLPVYFAFSGWNAAIFVGGEIREPAKNLPRALVGGTLVVTVLYLALCIGFLTVFTMDALSHTGEAGTAAAELMFGPLGLVGVTVAIMFAMLGQINGTILTGSRIAFAMAQDGQCIAAAGRTSRFGTPAWALWLQAAWTIVLVLTHRFEQLMNYASAAMLITGTLTVLAVFVLRKKLPDMPRPYRTWGYPITPILYAVSSLGVLGILAHKLDASVFLAVAWFVVALGFHHVVLRRRVVDREAPVSRDTEPV